MCIASNACYCQCLCVTLLLAALWQVFLLLFQVVLLFLWCAHLGVRCALHCCGELYCRYIAAIFPLYSRYIASSVGASCVLMDCACVLMDCAPCASVAGPSGKVLSYVFWCASSRHTCLSNIAGCVAGAANVVPASCVLMDYARCMPLWQALSATRRCAYQRQILGARARARAHIEATRPSSVGPWACSRISHTVTVTL